ncbi:hypothetical protein [Novosphingobium humi]|uniref:Uncharacterized protein n=1 Tax=Novosphingobium humi TaxID=2282397 RepID=A0ABY7TYN4_9SPHN|nr:hypothetical protein [Novosphingobium humi]WCT78394.1 hypothetical protein PQ457_05335 [Novosphingobium humi]
MKKTIGIASLLAMIASPALAQAPTVDEASQKLAECVTTKATAEDKTALSKWAAVEIAASSPAAGVVTVDAEKKAALDKDVAKIFTRLVVMDCYDVAKPLAKQGSAQMFRAAGAAFWRFAIRELSATPGVASGIVRSYVSQINQQDFIRLIQQ